MRHLPVILVASLVAAIPASAQRSSNKRPATPTTAARVAATASSAFVPNYAFEPHVAGKNRWRNLPVRVWFDTGGAYTDERRALALSGMDTWTHATDGVVSYRIVDAKNDADVVIRFDAGDYIDPHPFMAGRTWSSRRGPWLNKAQIALATGNTRPEELVEVAAHEWGHALGIHGHSDDPGDLMYSSTVRILTTDPFYTPKTRLPSERDVNTLKTIYAPLFAKRS